MMYIIWSCFGFIYKFVKIKEPWIPEADSPQPKEKCLIKKIQSCAHFWDVNAGRI